MDIAADTSRPPQPAVTVPLSGSQPPCTIQIDGTAVDAIVGERLIDALNRDAIARNRREVPQVCYHPHLGPIQTCDTCMVEIDKKLTRACSAKVVAGMSVFTE
ncbi:MAG TPA: 2Fe-2S iron-sulfur cluster-binding protein, partial [Silvibacterium sp.]|nr:2Fe-2S iron-sulfur cluster-binding protein [Silvibacterium sp.]